MHVLVNEYVVVYLHVRTYVHCIYTSTGKSESVKDKLRSIIAQFEYQYRIKQWEERGVEFTTYLYVPEVHPETNDIFYEREDEAHVLKVQCICMCRYIHVHVCKHVTSCIHVYTVHVHCMYTHMLCTSDYTPMLS